MESNQAKSTRRRKMTWAAAKQSYAINGDLKRVLSEIVNLFPESKGLFEVIRNEEKIEKSEKIGKLKLVY